MGVTAIHCSGQESVANGASGEIQGLGGYSEYTLADERLCFKLPQNISREEAVTAPLAACTAYLGLFSKSCLNVGIGNIGTTVLVWGGSCKSSRPWQRVVFSSLV